MVVCNKKVIVEAGYLEALVKFGDTRNCGRIGMERI